jgi:hypothetical protein
MNPSLSISPVGRLHVVDLQEGVSTVSEAAATALQQAFAQSNDAGLLLLASHELGEELPPTFVFWRNLARQLFQAVCHLGEGEIDKWDSLAAPGDE